MNNLTGDGESVPIPSVVAVRPPPDQLEPPTTSCEAEMTYVSSGNGKSALYLLSIGLTKNSSSDPLFCLDAEPWSRLPKSTLRPSVIDFDKEIGRRSKSLNINPKPRTKNWTNSQRVEWLQENPLTDYGDIAFLRREVRRVGEVLIRRVVESNGVNGVGGKKAHWRGPVPYLRIIMCLTETNVKRLFLTRSDSVTRPEFDARNSQSR